MLELPLVVKAFQYFHYKYPVVAAVEEPWAHLEFSTLFGILISSHLIMMPPSLPSVLSFII